MTFSSMKMCKLVMWYCFVTCLFGSINAQDPYYFAGTQNRFLPNYQQPQNAFYPSQPPAYRQQNYPQNTYSSNNQQRFPVSNFPRNSNQPAPFQLPSQNAPTSQYSQYVVEDPLTTVQRGPPPRPAPFQPQTSAATSFIKHPASSVQHFSHVVPPPTSHNHNPSQTETFLGQITIQSPEDLPEFQPPSNFEFSRTHDLVDRFPTSGQKWKSRPATNNRYPIESDTVEQDLDSYSDDEVLHTSTNPLRSRKPNNAQKSGTRVDLLNPQRNKAVPVPQESHYKNNVPSNDYYLNVNENDYTTPKSRFKSRTTLPSAVKKRTRFDPTTETALNKQYFESKRQPTSTTESQYVLNIKPLLEEEKEQGANAHNSDSNVEVIQSAPIPVQTTLNSHLDYLDTTVVDPTEPIGDEHHAYHHDDEYINSDYYHDDEAQYIKNSSMNTASHVTENNANSKNVAPSENYDSVEHISSLQEIRNHSAEEEKEAQSTLGYDSHSSVDNFEDGEDNFAEYKDSNNLSSSSSSVINETNYEIVTMNPSPALVENDNFKEFVDTTIMDSTEQPIVNPNESTTQKTSISAQSSVTMEDFKPTPPIVIKNVESKSNDQLILLGGAVVSVVTTKSVINGTVSVPSTSSPLVTKKVQTTIKPHINYTSTEKWLEVASVQTSRSISGARFLPFDTLEPEEKSQILSPENDNSNDTNTEITPDRKLIQQIAELDTTTMTEDQNINLQSSTESIIDKLDRVQSELSSGLLSGGYQNGNNNITVLTEKPQEKVEPSSTTTTLKPTVGTVQIKKFSYTRPTSTQRPNSKRVSFTDIKMDDLTGLLPAGFKPRFSDRKITTSTTTTTNAPVNIDEPQGDEPVRKFVPELKQGNVLSPRFLGATNKNKVLIQDNLSSFLPPGYKPPEETESPKSANSKNDANDKKNFKETKTEKSAIDKLFQHTQPIDISAFLPPGYKPSTEKPTITQPTPKITLSPIYKPENKTLEGIDKIIEKAKPIDISAFLPPGYKPPPSTEKPKILSSILDNAKPIDISAFLPPGFKLTNSEGPSSTEKIEIKSAATTAAPSTTQSYKVVFPSRPGGRKPINRGTSSSIQKPGNTDNVSWSVVPNIRKGLPTRATTEFTGWPTPSTTPISIEKLLEAARTATDSISSTSTTSSTTTTSTTTTTTTTTTTMEPTTPGVCAGDCELAATIKLVGGAKWIPELLDHNTKEWQLLANEVQMQLENVYSKSDELNRWFKKIRIDGFSEGSVLVDYFVELNELSRQVDTQELKKMFHAALHPVAETLPQYEDEDSTEALELRADMEGKLNLGSFILDPQYTDFIVQPKQAAPTVGYADENFFLPQWAIAVIVIGLASLLFVIIFGVTVLVNRQKNAKKKQPTPLTEDMLNELNKNHMGGFDNYGAEDLYNMEDVWNDRQYDMKPPKKRSSGSLHDNSMSNLYDSWKSEWNGYYYNAYYGNNPPPNVNGYTRRRSDYDTNF